METVTMNTELPIFPFAIALAIGALIGVEREWRKLESTTTGTGGIRTFILLAMSGAVSAWLSMRLESPWIFLAAAVCASAIIVAAYLVQALHFDNQHGLTTAVASLVTVLLGGTVIFGHAPLAVGLAIATSAILAFKQPLHRAVGWLSQDDLRAMLKLLIATFIVLPVFPDRTLDPWGALNPYKMWWVVILISALSLVGYVATRWIGENRAMPLTGLCGGLVSSTIVSLDFARRSREKPESVAWADSLASGMLAAWVVMFGRILGISAAINLPLLGVLWPSFAAMALATAAASFIYYRRAGHESESTSPVPLKNPFSLTAAMKFAAIFAVVLLIVKIVQVHYHGHGLNVVAALAGLAEVDAITLSMAQVGRVVEQLHPAGTAIAIATLSNTLIKCGFVLTLGSPALKRRIVSATLIILAAGVAAGWMIKT